MGGTALIAKKFGNVFLQRHLKFSKIQNRNKSWTQHGSWTGKPELGKSYLSVPGQQPLLGWTLGQLQDQTTAKYGDLEGLVVRHQNIRRTFIQLKKETEDFAEGLLALGLQKGDRLGIWGPNSHEWYLTQMAAAKAGLILVNINPAYEGPELLYALNKVGLRGLVIDDNFRGRNYYDILCSVVHSIRDAEPGKIKAPEAPNLSTVISVKTQPPKGTFSFAEVAWKGSQQDSKIMHKIYASVQFDDIFNIQFTSGTTGKPKGVMLSHHNMVNNSYLISKRFHYSTQDKLCVAVPFFHCYGDVAGVLAGLHAGASVVVPSAGFDAKEAVRAVEEEKCTALYGTPTMYVDMTTVLEERDVSSLNGTVTAGAICPEDLVREMRKSFGCKVTSLYGLTETSPVFYQSLPEDSDDLRTSTVGYPHQHVETRIIDKEGQIVPLGEPGEMCCRGYMTMLGYWDDPVKTKEVLSDSGWFHTGDVFVMEESGHARVVGRIKEMIIRGGENIYPREIEEFLHLHPKILEAHVFGLPDKRLGEIVGVWIRVKDGENLTEEELRADVKGKIAAYKVPKHIFFRNDFPKTASGKIQKFLMREETIKILGISEQK